MHEKPTRDIVVTVNGELYWLRSSLYGTIDAKELFQYGPVEHLQNGGYVQSKWNQCLFYKWISVLIYIYILFHVDDFNAAGTSEEILDEFEVHLNSKYEVTSNTDGVFLGIEVQHHGPERKIFRRPTMLQNIFDMYLSDGPTISSAPRGPMQFSYFKTFDQDDSPSVPASDFRSMIGMIQQLIDVRPDICFAVAKIAQRQASPRQKDVDALTYLIHFLFATRSSGVTLRRSDKCQADLLLTLRAFTDCSHACHGNKKSHNGFCFDLVDSNTAGTLGSDGSEYDPNMYGEEGPLLDTGMFYSKSVMASTVDLQSCEGGDRWDS